CTVSPGLGWTAAYIPTAPAASGIWAFRLEVHKATANGISKLALNIIFVPPNHCFNAQFEFRVQTRPRRPELLRKRSESVRSRPAEILPVRSATLCGPHPFPHRN